MPSITSQSNIVAGQRHRDYALGLYNAGFNIVPMRIDAKSPNLTTWQQYTTRSQTPEEILSLTWSGNIAIVNGINAMRTIDIDGCDNPDVLFKVLELLGLDFEYQWVVQTTGKGGGFHIHFRCPDTLTLTQSGVLYGDPLIENAFQQIELRWSGCLTMFPHSIHPDTKEPYSWLYGVPQSKMAVIPVTVAEKMFIALAAPRSTKNIEEISDQEQKKKIIKYDSWAQKALDQEISKVRAVSEGARNTQLNKSAFSLGQIVGAGLLDVEEIQGELSRAAGAINLDEKEIEATIKSGLDAGTKKPRMPKQVFKDGEPGLKLPPPKKVDDVTICSFSADDQGHAEAVYHLYGNYIAYNDAYGWMIWQGTHYVPSVQRINTLIVEVLRLRLRAAAHLERTDLAKVSRSMAGTVSATRSMLENLAFVAVDEFDGEADLINCLSGIINLKTKKLIPHDPTYRFTWCTPVCYNLNADGSLWQDFINETVQSKDMAGYLQEALGYSITGHTSEECLFYIFGPPRSGKGTLSETILAIFPRPIAIEVDFNTFTAKREGDSQNFDLAPMKAARLVFASESNKYQSLNPAKVKALTGGNLVSCAFKHRDMFSYRPQYAVWLSSNHEVNADADDDALWGRVKVVLFPNSRLGKEDKSLKRRMQSTENLEYVLAWLVEGAYLWYQREVQGLQTPNDVKVITQKQRYDQDSIGLWLEECCTIDTDSWTENNRLRTSYDTWCESNGYEPKKANGFARSLSAHGLEVGVRRRTYSSPGDDGTLARGVLGVRIS